MGEVTDSRGGRFAIPAFPLGEVIDFHRFPSENHTKFIQNIDKIMPEGSLGGFGRSQTSERDPRVVWEGPWSGFLMFFESQKLSKIEENLIKNQVVFLPRKKTVLGRSGVGQIMIFDAAQYR